MKQTEEKYREKKKDLYVAFLSLEKVWDRVDREQVWKVLIENQSIKFVWVEIICKSNRLKDNEQF